MLFLRYWHVFQVFWSSLAGIPAPLIHIKELYQLLGFGKLNQPELQSSGNATTIPAPSTNIELPEME